MIALARPGSLPWLVLHDVRVKARGREGRWGRIIALLLLALLPIVGGAVVAWRGVCGAARICRWPRSVRSARCCWA